MLPGYFKPCQIEIKERTKFFLSFYNHFPFGTHGNTNIRLLHSHKQKAESNPTIIPKHHG